jgi:dTDP-4-dehydrorhamnose 3,5-epimerase
MSIDFQIEKSNIINDVLIITPSISEDARGNIWTSFLHSEIDELLPEGLFFKHDKFSFSKNNVLRGIHGDSKSWKLVTCIHGEIQQVVVDLRKESQTYMHWADFTISHNNQILILLPPMMGNAYHVKSKDALYHYKLAYEGSYIDADQQFTYRWNDEEIGIKWACKKPILSDRDK